MNGKETKAFQTKANDVIGFEKGTTQNVNAITLVIKQKAITVQHDFKFFSHIKMSSYIFFFCFETKNPISNKIVCFIKLSRSFYTVGARKLQLP